MKLWQKVLAGWISLAVSGCASTTQYATPYVTSLLEARQQDVVVQKWDLSCGAADLATLLTYNLGLPTTEREVATALLKRYTNIGQVQQQLGFSLLDLKAYAESKGLTATGYGNLTLHDLAGMAPSIVPVRMNGFNHFVVFRGIRGDRVLLADPAFGNRTMHLGYFVSVWQGRMAFMVTRPGEVAGATANLLAPKPSDFWATSIGNEPVSATTLALEEEAAGTVLGAPTTKLASASRPTSAVPGASADTAANLGQVIAGGSPASHLGRTDAFTPADKKAAAPLAPDAPSKSGS
jgi:predicted double-glycine peptidase